MQVRMANINIRHLARHRLCATEQEVLAILMQSTCMIMTTMTTTAGRLVLLRVLSTKTLATTDFSTFYQ